MLQITLECHWQWNKVSVLFIFLAFFTAPPYMYIYLFFSFQHFLYVLGAMFLIHSPITLKQSGITHWWVESFRDTDNHKAVLNGIISSLLTTLLENHGEGKMELDLGGSEELFSLPVSEGMRAEQPYVSLHPGSPRSSFLYWQNSRFISFLKSF